MSMGLAWAFVYLVAGLCRGQGHLSVAANTIEKFVARAIRLYEQEPEEACASARLGLYVERWVGWATGGLAATT